MPFDDCENQSTFHHINDDAGDVCVYDDESEDEDEWKCFYVKVFTTY